MVWFLTMFLLLTLFSFDVFFLMAGAVSSGYHSDSSKKAWESIIGAALSSYNILCHNCSSGVDAIEKFLSLAKSYRSSSQVLSAVADHLESKNG